MNTPKQQTHYPIDWFSTHGEIAVVCTWPDDKIQPARVDVFNGEDVWTVQKRFGVVEATGPYGSRYTTEQLTPIWHTILVDLETLTGHEARRWIDMYRVACETWQICDMASILRENLLFARQVQQRIELLLINWPHKRIRLVNWPTE